MHSFVDETPFQVWQTDGGNSDISTADTIRKMVEIVHTNENLPAIQEVVQQILMGAGNTTSDKLNALYSWVKGHMRFKNDEDILDGLMGLPPDKELLFTPHFIVTNGWNYGDCDDYSTLLATLIVAAKIPVDTYFVTICADKDEPNRWSHVYVAVEDGNGKIIPLDASHGAYAGWETSKALKKKYWLVNKGRKENMAILGMGDMVWDPNIGTYVDSSLGTNWDPYSGQPVGIIPSGSSGGSSDQSSINYGSIITNAMNQGFGLAKMIISQPQPGQYMQTGPGGAVNYRLPSGSAGNFGTFSAPNLNLSGPGGSSMLLLLGGIALVVMLAAGKG